MKFNLRKLFAIATASAMSISLLAGCGSNAGTSTETSAASAETEAVSSSADADESVAASIDQDKSDLNGEVIGDHVIELPVITEIDYEAGLAKSKELFGKFGCSGIAKTLADGDTIVGRSFDFYYSNNPAYVIRTDVDGFYKTVGLAYNTFDGHTFEDVKENGVTQDELNTLLFFTEDVMNEKGLYIEANMRSNQPESTGIAPSTGTNPESKVSMSFPALVRYLGERCATVEEAVELADSLNIYGFITDEDCWGGGYLMADASGHCGVLELVDNKLIWTDGQNCQTNFYINDEYKDKAVIGSGVGRYKLLQSKIDDVQSVDDMTDLIKLVRYSAFIDPYNCPFDPSSELSDFGDEYAAYGGALTIEMCESGEYKDQIFEELAGYGEVENAKSLQQLRDEGTQWQSVWQTIANCNKQTLKVIFFEDDSLTYDFAVQ